MRYMSFLTRDKARPSAFMLFMNFSSFISTNEFKQNTARFSQVKGDL